MLFISRADANSTFRPSESNSHSGWDLWHYITDAVGEFIYWAQQETHTSHSSPTRCRRGNKAFRQDIWWSASLNMSPEQMITHLYTCKGAFTGHYVPEAVWKCKNNDLNSCLSFHFKHRGQPAWGAVTEVSHMYLKAVSMQCNICITRRVQVRNKKTETSLNTKTTGYNIVSQK